MRELSNVNIIEEYYLSLAFTKRPNTLIPRFPTCSISYKLELKIIFLSGCEAGIKVLSGLILLRKSFYRIYISKAVIVIIKNKKGLPSPINQSRQRHCFFICI